MRILHLLSQTELTGAEVYAAQLTRLQVKDQHQVFVISDRIHVPFETQYLSLPISTKSFWQRMKNILQIRSFLKDQSIDVIHCHSRGAVRHAFWARMGLPIGLTTTLHGEQHPSFSKKWLHIYGEVLIAICENIKLAMISNFKTPESIIRVIRNPVDTFQISRSPRSSPHLAMAGRSSGPKGFNFEQVGLQSFRTWLEQIPNLKISIIASQPERFSADFKDLVEQLNKQYPGQIIFEGHVSNLRGNLTTYDLVIGSGRIAIEALLSKIQLLSMGEYCTHGLINISNYSEALKTNFGDIGPGAQRSRVDFQKVSDEVLKYFKTKPLDDSEALFTKALRDFSDQTVHQKILEVYKGAIFKRRHPKWIPILMYHKVPDQELQSKHRIFVTKENFRNHLSFFKSKGFQTLTFKDFLAFWDLQKPMSLFPKKPLFLTFDDGYKDNLTNVQPLLKEMQMKATIFLLAEHSITQNTWDADTGETPSELMTFEEKKRLDQDCFEIGSHGFHHLHLTEHRDKALQEMSSSKKQLETDFNSTVISFAYPFGSTDLDLAEMCFQAGYRFAVNTDQGGLHLGDNPQFLFRVNIFPEENRWSLRKKTSPWYRNYFFKKRGR